jgi:hypothetical protein
MSIGQERWCDCPARLQVTHFTAVAWPVGSGTGAGVAAGRGAGQEQHGIHGHTSNARYDHATAAAPLLVSTKAIEGDARTGSHFNFCTIRKKI